MKRLESGESRFISSACCQNPAPLRTDRDHFCCVGYSGYSMQRSTWNPQTTGKLDNGSSVNSQGPFSLRACRCCSQILQNVRNQVSQLRHFTLVLSLQILPEVISYNALLSATATATQTTWCLALALLNEAVQQRLADVITFNAEPRSQMRAVTSVVEKYSTDSVAKCAAGRFWVSTQDQ